MTDSSQIEVITKEGRKQSFKPIQEWASTQLAAFDRSTPNEQAREKVNSTCQFMREGASYFAELARDGRVNEKQLKGYYETYRNKLRERAAGMTGGQLVTDLSANCRSLAECLQSDNFDNLTAAELIGLCRVLQAGITPGTDPQKGFESVYVLSSMIQEKVTLPTKQVETQSIPTLPSKETERPTDTEHIFYSPRIDIVPDRHGLSPDVNGIDGNSKNVVYVGDIIDAPKDIARYKNPYDNDPSVQARDRVMRDKASKYGWGTIYTSSLTEEQYLASRDKNRIEWNKKYEAAQHIDIRKNVIVATELLNNGEGQVVLGNHEMMAMSGLTGNDNDLSQWLLDENKGKSTLEAFGIDTSQIPRVELDAQNNMTALPHDTCDMIRQKINSNPELKGYFDALFSKGKMYVVANEVLVLHAGIPVSKDGRLIPPQKDGKDWPGFEGVTGLNALDKIEEGIRTRDPEIMHRLAGGKASDMTPGWVRDPFFAIMRDDSAAEVAISELDTQAKERGGAVKAVAIGHTEAVGGTRVGKYVLGTDTAVGDVVTLESKDKKNVTVNSNHNFGAKGQISYSLTNSL